MGTQHEYILEMKGISKSFGGVHALQDIDFRVRYKEIVALVGDNGAGKTTLAKIVSGALVPDKGEILFEGKKVYFNNPKDSAKVGIGMGYQSLALVDMLDVSANLFLGREKVKRLFGGAVKILKLKQMRKESKQVLRDMGIEIDSVKEKVCNLSGGQRQSIAIGRAAGWGTKLVIMDEPTASMGVRESQKVLSLIKGLKKKNVSVITISHNLQHVFTIADRVVVLRQGRYVGERLIKATDGDEVVKLIMGAELAGEKI